MRATRLAAALLSAGVAIVGLTTAPSGSANAGPAGRGGARPHVPADAMYVGRSLDPAVPGAETLLQVGSPARRVAFFTATLPCLDGSARQVLLGARVSRAGAVSGAAGTTTLDGRVVGRRKLVGTVSDSACGSTVAFSVRRKRPVVLRTGGTFHGTSTAVDPGGHPYGANLSLAADAPRRIAALSTSLACTAGSDEILQSTGKRIHASGAFAFRAGGDIVAGRLVSHRRVRVVASDASAGCRSTIAVIDLRLQR